MTAAQGTTTVAVVDDEEPVCGYLGRILGAADGLSVIGHALDGGAGVRLVRRARPDVLLLDLRMPGVDGVAVLDRLREDGVVPGRDVAVLLLTNFTDLGMIRRGLDAGACGVLLKSAAPPELVSGVRLAAAGHRVLGAGVDLTWSGGPAGRDAPVHLTGRERDVLRLVGEGCSNREVADALDLRESTVKGHVSALMAKMGCRSRLQLGLRAADPDLGADGRLRGRG